MDMCAVSVFLQPLCNYALCHCADTFYSVVICWDNFHLTSRTSQRWIAVDCPLKLSVLNFQACKGEGGQSASNHTDTQASPAKKKRTASPAKVQQRCTRVTIPEGWNLKRAKSSFCSRSQGAADTWANNSSQQQIPSWYLTPQKLQVRKCLCTEILLFCYLHQKTFMV